MPKTKRPEKAATAHAVAWRLVPLTERRVCCHTAGQERFTQLGYRSRVDDEGNVLCAEPAKYAVELSDGTTMHLCAWHYDNLCECSQGDWPIASEVSRLQEIQRAG